MLICPQIGSSQNASKRPGPRASKTWSAERARVTRHLQRAEWSARGNDVGHLPFLRRLVRALLLDELAHYRRDARFPLNLGFEDHTPCFVDIAGTRCAMAHLLEVSGESALVTRIARERNHARVRELSDEPKLVAWLGAAGISLEEAAAIQPTYTCVDRAACVCGGESRAHFIPALSGGQPADGVLVGTMLRANGVGMVMHVDSTHGDVGSLAVGSELEVTPVPFRSDLPSAVVGSVVPVHSRAADASSATPSELNAIVLGADGTFTCRTRDLQVGPLQPAQLISALQAEDCPDTLSTFNAKWDDTRCDKEGMMCAVSARAASADVPTSLSILLVLASSLVARRRARRQRGT